MEIGDMSEGLTGFPVVHQNLKQMVDINFSNRKKTSKLQNHS